MYLSNTRKGFVCGLIAALVISIQAIAQTPAKLPAEKDAWNVTDVDSADIGEKIKLVTYASSLKELQAKARPTVVVVHPDQDRTLDFWRSDDGQWSLAEVFKFKAAGGYVYAIGRINNDYNYRDGKSYPVFKRILPREKKVEHKITACPKHKDFPDACGVLSYKNGPEWVRWTRKIAGNGGIVEQNIYFFRRDSKGGWYFYGNDSVSCGRCGAAKTFTGKTSYWFDPKNVHVSCKSAATSCYAIGKGEADDLRLPITRYTWKTIRDGKASKPSRPYIKISDLEPFKDKYMGGEITLESIAGLMTLRHPFYNDTQKRQAKEQWLKKLKLANPQGIEVGTVYLEPSRPLTKESLDAIEKYKKIFPAKGFSEDGSAARYKKHNVRMSQVWPLIKELGLKFRPQPGSPMRPCMPEPTPPEYRKPKTQTFSNRELYLIVDSDGRDIMEDDTLVDLAVRIKITKKPFQMK